MQLVMERTVTILLASRGRYFPHLVNSSCCLYLQMSTYAQFIFISFTSHKYVGPKGDRTACVRLSHGNHPISVGYPLNRTVFHIKSN